MAHAELSESKRFREIAVDVCLALLPVSLVGIYLLYVCFCSWIVFTWPWIPNWPICILTALGGLVLIAFGRDRYH